jgi:hypothetical protein
VHEALQGLGDIVAGIAECYSAGSVATFRKTRILPSAKPIKSNVAGQHNFNGHAGNSSIRTISVDIYSRE